MSTIAKINPCDTRVKSDLGAKLDDAFSVAESDGFPHCDDYDPHDPATCTWCALRSARSAYRAAARAPVIARLRLLDTITLEYDTPITALADKRRRRRDRARIAYEAVATTGTPRQQIDAAAALELAEGEFEAVYEKSLDGYIYEQRDSFSQDFKRRFAELEELEFIIPYPEFEWRREYLKQEEAIWMRAHNANWRGAVLARVKERGSQWVKDNAVLVMLSTFDLPSRRYNTVGEFIEYVENLQTNERFRRWAARQRVRSA